MLGATDFTANQCAYNYATGNYPATLVSRTILLRVKTRTTGDAYMLITQQLLVGVRNLYALQRSS